MLLRLDLKSREREELLSFLFVGSFFLRGDART
jgi:hypothetical protein